AATLSDASFHLTISLHPIKLYEFYNRLLEKLAYENLSLRKRVSLSVMQGKEKLPSVGNMLRNLAVIADEIGESINPNLVIRNVVANCQVTEDIDDATFSTINLEKINLNTTVKHPRGVEFTWFKAGEEIRVVCGGTIHLPTKVESCLEFIKLNSSFKVKDIPSSITEKSKIVLVRNLVKNGLLRIISIGKNSSSKKDAKDKFLSLS
ncbi:hypothetical protein OAG73_00230, partial [bacterium]|nr:hypothetical protein [bacterium]